MKPICLVLIFHTMIWDDYVSLCVVQPKDTQYCPLLWRYLQHDEELATLSYYSSHFHLLRLWAPAILNLTLFLMIFLTTALFYFEIRKPLEAKMKRCIYFSQNITFVNIFVESIWIVIKDTSKRWLFVFRLELNNVNHTDKFCFSTKTERLTLTRLEPFLLLLLTVSWSLLKGSN